MPKSARPTHHAPPMKEHPAGQTVTSNAGEASRGAQNPRELIGAPLRHCSARTPGRSLTQHQASPFLNTSINSGPRDTAKVKNVCYTEKEFYLFIFLSGETKK